MITGAVLIAVIVAGIINASTSTTTITTTATATTVNSTNGNTIVKILLIIINTIASGFHWLASFFAFKPITQGQPGEFYVPILEWGWNYAFGTRIVPLAVNTTTSYITNNTLSLAYYWVINLIGNTVKWVLSDSLGHSISGNMSMSGYFPAAATSTTSAQACSPPWAPWCRGSGSGSGGNVYIPLYDTMTLTLPSSGVTKTIIYSPNGFGTQTTTLTWTCTVNPGSTQVDELGQTVTYNVNCPQPGWVYVYVDDNLSNNFGPAYYVVYSGEANYQTYYTANNPGIFNWKYVLPLPGLSGYVWGVVTGRVPNNYAGCYLYNASLPSIGSNPPQYPVSNGSSISLYVHCIPGSGVVYWVVNVQGSGFNGNGEWVLTDSYGHTVVDWSGSASGNFTVNGPDTLSISIMEWSSHLNCQVTSPSSQTVNPGQTATFDIYCTYSSGGGGGGSGGGGGGSGGGSGSWTLYINVNDNYGFSVGYQISDNQGHSIIGYGALSNYQFATYSSSVKSVSLSASIQSAPSGWSCSITPSSTTVNAPSGGTGSTSVTFTVSCNTGSGGSGGSSPTSTSTSTSTPTTTPTSTSTPTPTPTSTSTSTTTSSGGSGGGGGSSTSPTPTKTTSTYGLGCAGNGQTVNNIATYSCWATWSNAVATLLTATVEGTNEYITLTGPALQAQTVQGWYAPPNCELEVVGGGTFKWSGWASQGYQVWYITLSPICQGGKGRDIIFLTRWEWNPPEIPLTWLLRGGTNTLAPLEPLYIKAWNEYVNAWLSENGFMLDLLILLALITPILVRPATRRLRLV